MQFKNEDAIKQAEAQADAEILQLQQQMAAQQASAPAAQVAPVSQPTAPTVGDVMPFSDAPVIGQQPTPEQPVQTPVNQANQLMQPPQNTASAADPNAVQMMMQQQMLMQQQMQQIQQMQVQMQQLQKIATQASAAAQAGHDVENQATGIDAVMQTLRSNLEQISDDFEDTAVLKSSVIQAMEELGEQVRELGNNAQVTAPEIMPMQAPDDDGHGGQLSSSHPDWVFITTEPTFQSWVQRDAERVRISKEGMAPEVIWLLSEYKRRKANNTLMMEMHQPLQTNSHQPVIAPNQFAQQQPGNVPAHMPYQAQPHIPANAAAAALPVPLHTQANNGAAQPNNGQQALSETQLMQALADPNDRYGQKFAESEQQIDAMIASLTNSM